MCFIIYVQFSTYFPSIQMNAFDFLTLTVILVKPSNSGIPKCCALFYELPVYPHCDSSDPRWISADLLTSGAHRGVACHSCTRGSHYAKTVPILTPFWKRQGDDDEDMSSSIRWMLRFDRSWCLTIAWTCGARRPAGNEEPRSSESLTRKIRTLIKSP
jgi:hypothetical protein